MCIISYLSYLHWTFLSSTNSLILVNSHCSSHNRLFSLFPPYSFMFYFLPFLSIFSWSMCAGLTYLNLVVTICILHSWSTQYKHTSSLILQVILSPWELVALSFILHPFERLHIGHWSLCEYCLTVGCLVKGYHCMLHVTMMMMQYEKKWKNLEY